MADAHLKVGRHGGVVELMYLSHRISFWLRRPQQDENARTNAEELRTKIPQSISILFVRVGGSDKEICICDLLAWLPEPHLIKVSQIPGHRPRIRSDHRDAGSGYAISARQISRSPQEVRGCRPKCAHRHRGWFHRQDGERPAGGCHAQSTRQRGLRERKRPGSLSAV